jgi:NAD(P)H-dependent flavin oxidoreductase YrpB (nitropropane dioxygenase family)
VVTRAFTGRPARGLRNAFIDRYERLAPLGYPALHHLTGPLRRAAVTGGDPEMLAMWAGAGYRHATDGPAAAVIARLAGDLP